EFDRNVAGRAARQGRRRSAWIRIAGVIGEASHIRRIGRENQRLVAEVRYRCRFWTIGTGQAYLGACKRKGGSRNVDEDNAIISPIRNIYISGRIQGYTKNETAQAGRTWQPAYAQNRRHPRGGYLDNAIVP